MNTQFPPEERDVQQTLLPVIASNLPLLERISSYHLLVRIIAWILQFASNAIQRDKKDISPVLSLSKLQCAKEPWWKIAQNSAFWSETYSLESGKGLSLKSKIFPFHPYLDQQGILHIGDRLQRRVVSFTKPHPVLLPRSHRVTKHVIVAEHLCVLHAEPTLVSASLSCRFSILGRI